MPACKIVAVTLPPALESSLLVEAVSICRSMPVDAIARREAGEALTAIARTFGVSHTTISRL